MERGGRALLLYCLPLLALAGLNACPSACLVDYPCGNGFAEGSEDCDGLDLRWQTCGDIVQGGQGALVCREDCSFDITDCLYCGDGERQFGEQCDCGTDPNNLPAGCTDANGGGEANCSMDCMKLPYCGDGIQDRGEDCDCGTDPDNLPAGCTDVNGGANANCYEECEHGDVWGELGEPCDPLVLNQCSDDDWGHRLVCVTFLGEGYPSYCMRECTSTADCYWGWFCSAALGNICQPETCGPTASAPNAETNAFCTVSGGDGQGWCAPVTPRVTPTDPSMGQCVESGSLAHGAICRGLGAIDRFEEACTMGFCDAPSNYTEGHCHQFCDWEAAYAVAFYGAEPSSEVLPCPSGANCFAESTIDESTGIRSGDLAFCVDAVATDPTDGMTSCSLVSGQLLASPSETCQDAGFTHGRCEIATLETGHAANGTVIGICTDGAAAVNKAVWDPCDPTTTNDVCPTGSQCEKPDRFAVTPAMAERCVPLCDTAHPLGAETHCADLGAAPTSDGTPVCQSMSLLFPPCGPLDVMPTRLGLCGL